MVLIFHLDILLKYNVLEDFLTESSYISSGVQACLCRGRINNMAHPSGSREQPEEVTKQHLQKDEIQGIGVKQYYAVEDANPREEAFLAMSTPAIQTTGPAPEPVHSFLRIVSALAIKAQGRISIVASPVTAGFKEDTASGFSRIYARTSGLQEGESHDLHISGGYI
ncbi:hypothetical protein YC2023_050902 [Brassica napus]